MKYRTKLYISLVAVALVSIILALIIFSSETEKLVLKMIKSRTLSVAATTAAGIDPGLIKTIRTGTSIDDPNYVKLRKDLFKALNANRREDIYISDIYTLYLDPENEKQLLYGVETSTPVDLPGAPYIDSDKDLIVKFRDTYFVDPTYVSDQYGVWLSAYAPIWDKDGKYVSTVGVDINAADIHLRIIELMKFGMYGLSASLILSLLIAHFLSKRVTGSLDHISHVVKEIEEGNLEARAEIESEDEFGLLSGRINSMCQGLQERERLKTSFARYVSGHILDKILKTEAPLNLGGERRKVTLLFSDIRQFTRLAEELPPEEVVHLLNEYFEQMIEVIFSHFGTLDKFIGDGIMAEFGAPLDDEKQEIHAIRTALGMQKALIELCNRWEREGKPRIQIGIGIHTGEAIVGNIGSDRRTEYTAVGDTVNVAARLEQATKLLNQPILVSEMTYLGAKDHFHFKDLGMMTLPGRKEQIRVYTIEEKS